MSLATITIHIDGMTCQGCVAGVTRALKMVPGVADVAVSLDDGSVTVCYDDAQTDPSALIAAIEGAGFDAKMPTTALDFSP